MRVDDKKKNVVLVIEDDQDVLSVLVKHLAYMGYEIITARDGMEGLKKLNSERFDLVITDIVMPYVSGLGLVTTLKERKPEIPVIAITGFGKEPETAALEKKADLVLAKPIRMSELEKEIHALLKKKGENSDE
jgi:DNA-binding response OmpR family regulator